MSNNLTVMQGTGVSDLSFAAYHARQEYAISAVGNKERALQTKPAGNFSFSNGSWSPVEYEGFAVVSMVNENEGNEPLAARLVEIQKELQYNLTPTYAFYQLPAASFHQTVANTLSADRFKNNIVNAGLEAKYPAMVASAFEQLPAEQTKGPLRMRMAGLNIFGTAIGILGVFDNEHDYDRVTDFRVGFYGNRSLAQLDVKLTRPFIGHITLAYIEHSLNKNQKYHLIEVINDLNAVIEKEELYFNIAHTGLRRYHHLAEFIKQDNFPCYNL